MNEEAQEDTNHSKQLKSSDAEMLSNQENKLYFELLPPGFWYRSDISRELLKVYPHLNTKWIDKSIDRLRIISDMKPLKMYRGSAHLGKNIYCAFEFEDCVVAECEDYGNAIFAVRPKDNWRFIFSLPKQIARKKPEVTVMHHKNNWPYRLSDYIRDRYLNY